MAEVQNPYVAGSPLSGTEMFFGRADVFEFVKQTMAREHGDHVIALYGQRRTGKTSVLKQLHRHLDARYLCVFIDLHLLALDGLNSFLWELARHIRRELEREHQITLPALDRETFMVDARDAFRSLFLDQVWAAIGDRQLLLMVDEAVRLQEQISAGRLEREVFDYLRHLMQHYPRLQFLFALGISLEDMEPEYARLFSVGLYRKISFLERSVAEALITDPVRGCYELEPAAVARVYQTTSGHPYYTQLLCHSLFNRWHEQPTDRLTEADVNGVLEEVTERGSAALKNVWDDSTLGERVVMAGLAAAIGDAARAVSTADLTRFWSEHGLEIVPGERVRAFKSLFGRDILVGDDAPSFTLEMQRRWIEKWCRPEWVRQEVADALDADAATAAPGGARPVARSYKLIEPTPAPPELAPPPLVVVNPYVPGNPLSSTEMFFGREDIFEFVKQTLAREHGDRVIVLYGQRRTGKTSVLKQLHRHLDARYLCVFIDLHLLELNGLNGFLWQLARHIRRELERDHQISLPALDRETFMADARDAFRSLFLDQVWDAIGERRLLLMVDEAVRLQEQISAGRLERDVFDYLRHLMQHYPRLQFLFSLGSGLEEMEHEYAFLFSDGLYKKISFLERPVAEALITEPVRGCYELEPSAVARVYQTTSGHPYYTQLLCHSLFNRWHEQPRDRLTEADVNGVLEEVTERGSAALKNVWDDSTLGERVVMAGLAAAIGDEARVVRTADLTRFWDEHGLEIAPGETVRSFRSLLGRDILVGDDYPTFTVEMQRRWIEKWCRPEWVRQEVADALAAEAAAAAGVAGPIARSFRLFEPAPEAPALAPQPRPAPQPPPPPSGLLAMLNRALESRAALIFATLVVVILALLWALWGSGDRPVPPASPARPASETAAPAAKNETPAPVPAKAAATTAEVGPSATPPVGVAAAATDVGAGLAAATPPAAVAAGGQAERPAERLPTPIPPPVLRGDELDLLIFEAADKFRLPRVALLALAHAESDRRSDLVEPATLEEALQAWPAVYAGWARQRVALTEIGELLLDPEGKPPAADMLERVINSSKKAGPAGDRAAAMLKTHLPDPDPPRNRILSALLAYHAQNTDRKIEALQPRELDRYDGALTWAEERVQSMPSPVPVTAALRPTPTLSAPVVTPSATAVAAKPTSRFNPNEPTVLQTGNWNDSVAVTTWMLRSLGHDVRQDEVEDMMVKSKIALPEVGLLDARGTVWAQFISTTWNEKTFNKAPVSFDEVAAIAGRYPIAIFGRSWVHWTGVRGLSPEGELLLANPATGSRFGQQRLNREQFEVLGPFSAVWIDPESTPRPDGSPVSPRP